MSRLVLPWLLALAAFAPATSHAQSPGRVAARDAAKVSKKEVSSLPRGKSPQELSFSAGHVELGKDFSSLSLSNGVELTVNRYRLTADQLTLARSPQGLQVKGDGAVAFCPCVEPPLTVGFTHATVAPPTDLMLRSATFRACGVPVFWLPAFWVRSVNRSGMMSPRLEYRGTDGFFFGTGLHIPLSKSVEPSPEYLDVSMGAYGIRGVDLGAQLVTVNTATALRWDYLRRGFYELDAIGHRALGKATSSAWRIEALRGRRSRTGYVAFEAATRPYDRTRAEVLQADGVYLLGVGIQDTAQRSTAVRELGSAGPVARVGIGTAIADFGQVDSSLTAFGVVRGASEAEPIVLHSSTLEVEHRVGPFAVKNAARENWVFSGSSEQTRSGVLGAESVVGLPLLRGFGSGQSPLTHWLEPQVLGTVGIERSERVAPSGASSHPVSLQAGLLNVLGRARGAENTSLLLRGGGVGSTELVPAFAARWLASGNWFALGATAGAVQPWRRARAWMSSVRGRVGRDDRMVVGARLDGRSAADSLALRWLLDEGFEPRLGDWYSQPGWTLGGDTDIAVLEQVAFLAGSVLDVQRQEWLSHRMGAAYRHPCGCLAVSSLAGWRVGREGWDLSLTVDLMP